MSNNFEIVFDDEQGEDRRENKENQPNTKEPVEIIFDQSEENQVVVEKKKGKEEVEIYFSDDEEKGEKECENSVRTNQYTIIEEDWWILYRNFFVDLFEKLYIEIRHLVGEYQVTAPFKGTTKFKAKRLSCRFTEVKKGRSINKNKDGTYNYPLNDWSLSPTIMSIRKEIESFFQVKYDYCLTHLYRDGNDDYGYHADRECPKTSITSVNFGQPRKFRFRRIGKKNGWDKEYILATGDVLFMKAGCQKNWKHGVPVEKKANKIRINLTFRVDEKTDIYSDRTMSE